jgi:hypothetical protein
MPIPRSREGARESSRTGEYFLLGELSSGDVKGSISGSRSSTLNRFPVICAGGILVRSDSEPRCNKSYRHSVREPNRRVKLEQKGRLIARNQC